MYLVSTGKTTILSDFNNLETKSIYQHANGETTDFQFYTRQSIFLEVNKKSWLEVMRIKDKSEQNLQIDRVRKLNIPNIYCAACAKQSLEEMAFGGVNGQVSLYNYKTSEFMHRFKTENNRNSVLYLDYNGTDEYIASVYENGLINVFGTTTKTKVESVNIDGNTTLARFHPAKRFQLSIASFKGSVTVYDLQTKRKIFHLNDAHASPCRDLCMSAATPDMLISVGYDCILNVFDTRRRTAQIKLNHPHPLSTVAISPCGTYFSVGNLKGELISYDIRAVEKALATKKVHICPVTRVAFVPSTEEDNSVAASFSAVTANNSDASGATTEMVGMMREQQKSVRQRDSFCDFLDFQTNKLDRKSARFNMRRESFDWNTLGCRVPPEQNPSFISESNLNTSSESASISTAASCENSKESKSDISFDYVNTRRDKRAEEGKRHLAVLPTVPLHDRNSLTKVVTNLKQIEEEESAHLLQQNGESDKENPNKIEIKSNIASTDQSHTRSKCQKKSNSNILPLDITNNSYTGVKEPSRDNSDVEIQRTKSPQWTNTSEGSEPNLSQQIANLRVEMNSRFQQLESDLKFNAEQNKWQIFTQNADIWARQMSITEDIRDALSYLLQTDPFVNEFLRLIEENALLKSELQLIRAKKTLRNTIQVALQNSDGVSDTQEDDKK